MDFHFTNPDGSKSVTMTNNPKHIAEIEAFISSRKLQQVKGRYILKTADVEERDKLSGFGETKIEQIAVENKK